MSLWGTPLLRFAYGITQNQADAEDAVQETFLRLWQKHRRSSATQITRAYAYQTVLNVCRTQYRKNRRRHELSRQDIDGSPGLDIATKLDVYHAVMASSPVDREIILLHYFADLSIEETAQVLGIGIATAKTRLFRARQRLAQQLPNYEPATGGSQ